MKRSVEGRKGGGDNPKELTEIRIDDKSSRNKMGREGGGKRKKKEEKFLIFFFFSLSLFFFFPSKRVNVTELNK